MSSAQAPLAVSAPDAMGQQKAESTLAQSGTSKSNYKGFVAGVFSGIAKLSGKSCFHSLCLVSGLKLTLFLSSWTSVRMIVSLRRIESYVNEIAQVRYRQGSPTNKQRCTVPRTVGLHVANSSEGRSAWVLQGSYTAAGRMDGDGFCVSFWVPDLCFKQE